ncbi:hypothetical protein OBB01_04675, partial [Bacteroidota bacterium]|nr:hypothetical protein [Bacteroidota bacterium]
LFYNGNVIETFGDINLDGSGTAWEYTDSWAYKDSSGTVTFDSTSYWIFGGINCTDNTNNIYATQCPYPLCPLPLTSGCTDPLASNFDLSATYNDGTCLYPGCLDPYATNYCGTCNVSDSTQCVYSQCNSLDLEEDFESYDLSINGWSVYAGTQAGVIMTTSNAIADTVSLEFTGGNSWGSTPYSASQAFAYVDHVSGANVCLDLSSYLGSTIHMSTLVHMDGYYSNYPYSWLRVLVNGNVISDFDGFPSYTRQLGTSQLAQLDSNVGIISAPTTLYYDLSPYAGQSNVYVTFETSCKYGPTWTNNTDHVWIDDVEVYEVNPCSYFSLTFSSDSTTCNGSSDGTATVLATNDSLYSDTYTYLWSGGQTTQSIAGLVAGTYSCIVTGNTYQCNDTIIVTVLEPDSILISASVVSSTTPVSANGSVDLTTTGGTPPYSYLWSNGSTNEDVNNLSFGPISCVVTDNNGCQSNWGGFIGVSLVSGCTDSLAINFDPTANVDDSSCVYAGCMDSLAINYFSLATIDDSSCIYPNYMSLQGIMDFTVPAGGSSGKAIHLVATGNILDLSDYGIGVANNGGGTDGQEYTFPSISVSLGDHILLARDTSAMSSYFDICYSQFDIILLAPSAISQNGDDAIELFHYGNVVETFGDINVDGTGTPWDYLDSWAYKDASGTITFDSTNYWIFGGVNCTDNSTTTYDSGCPYPFCPIPLVNDCNGILGGPALVDDCGVCQLAYIYNFVTHIPTYVNDTSGLVLGPTEILVLPNDPTNPNWNSTCSGCTDSLALNYDSTATINDGSCTYAIPPALALQGIMDFTVPTGGSDGKAIHVIATDNIADLSVYGIGVANNGGGTDGQEYTFDSISVSLGDHILVARSISAMTAYFDACYNEFDHVLVATSSISQNGDDAIELFYNGNVIETFGDINVDGTGQPWDYMDSWAYKDSSGTISFSGGNWIFGGVNCTDGSTTTYDSGCPYPLCPATTNIDCNGVQNGPALVDGCGVCQLAYVYNFVTHIPTFVSDTSGLVLGPTEALILPSNPTNPLWNASCQGCTDPLALNYDSSAIIDDGSCTYAPTPVQAPLFFSEYAEGSLNNKYFEIYNPTSDTVSLSNYAYPSVANAPSTAGQYEYWNDFDAGAYILPNDVYVVAHPLADPLISVHADETHQYLSNGDDGYGLVFGNQSSYVVIDWLGDWNGDPGSGWSVAGVSNATRDHTLVRKCGILNGDTSWSNAAGVDSLSSQWLVYPNETWTYLGSHTTTCQTAIYGCTDPTALNYDSTATIDDGSCTYLPVDCYGIVNGISIIDSCGVCQPALIYNFVTHVAVPLLTDTSSVVLGPTEMIVLPSNPMNSYWNASCSGCTDPTALNYDSTATIDDGSCIAIVYGCTDPNAINYFPGANVDDGSCCLVVGCTDPLAPNYDPLACIDDGSCIIGSTCSGSPITNLGVTNVIHNRATFTFDDMNSSTCRVDQLRIKYREVGTSAWSQKNMGSPTGYDPATGICNSTNRTDKLVLGLSANTTYEWQMRVWYCSTGATAWVNGPNFTTLADCPNVGNLAVTTPNSTKATFTWDNSNGAYSF